MFRLDNTIKIGNLEVTFFKSQSVMQCFFRSSVSFGRPYSDSTVYYYFSPFLSGRYFRDDTMDLLEIFRRRVRECSCSLLKFVKKFTSCREIRPISVFSCPPFFSETTRDRVTKFSGMIDLN